ncbi:pentachlorophenol monooxygenase [Gracilaria domingensis]|nr:pentachlorophenol monooxygenase [Gracilaria domingensis]
MATRGAAARSKRSTRRASLARPRAEAPTVGTPPFVAPKVLAQNGSLVYTAGHVREQTLPLARAAQRGARRDVAVGPDQQRRAAVDAQLPGERAVRVARGAVRQRVRAAVAVHRHHAQQLQQRAARAAHQLRALRPRRAHQQQRELRAADQAVQLRVAQRRVRHALPARQRRRRARRARVSVVVAQTGDAVHGVVVPAGLLRRLHAIRQLFAVRHEDVVDRVRAGDHLRPDRLSLAFIALQHLRGAAPAEHHGQLPPHVVRVLHAAIHALSAGRRVYVRRVAHQNHVPVHVFGGLLLPHAPFRNPFGLAQLHVLHQRLDHVLKQLACLILVVVVNGALEADDDAIQIVRKTRKQQEALLRHVVMNCVFRPLKPTHGRVHQLHYRAFVHVTVKLKPRLPAYHAAHAVASDNPLGGAGPLRTVGVPNDSGVRFLISASHKLHQLSIPLYLNTILIAQMMQQNTLGFRLTQRQNERERRIQVVEIELWARALPLKVEHKAVQFVANAKELVCYTHVLKHFHGSRVDCEGARCVAAMRLSVDDAQRDVSASQFDCENQSGTTSAEIGAHGHGPWQGRPAGEPGRCELLFRCAVNNVERHARRAARVARVARHVCAFVTGVKRPHVSAQPRDPHCLPRDSADQALHRQQCSSAAAPPHRRGSSRLRRAPPAPAMTPAPSRSYRQSHARSAPIPDPHVDQVGLLPVPQDCDMPDINWEDYDDDADEPPQPLASANAKPFARSRNAADGRPQQPQPSAASHDGNSPSVRREETSAVQQRHKLTIPRRSSQTPNKSILNNSNPTSHSNSQSQQTSETPQKFSKKHWCTTCGIFATSERTLKQHFNGKKHAAKLKENETQPLETHHDRPHTQREHHTLGETRDARRDIEAARADNSRNDRTSNNRSQLSSGNEMSIERRNSARDTWKGPQRTAHQRQAAGSTDTPHSSAVARTGGSEERGGNARPSVPVHARSSDHAADDPRKSGASSLRSSQPVRHHYAAAPSNMQDDRPSSSYSTSKENSRSFMPHGAERKELHPRGDESEGRAGQSETMSTGLRRLSSTQRDSNQGGASTTPGHSRYGAHLTDRAATLTPIPWNPFSAMYNASKFGKQGVRIPQDFLDERMSMSEWRELRRAVFEKGNDVDKLAFKILVEMLLSPTRGVREDALDDFNSAIKKMKNAHYFSKETGSYMRYDGVPEKMRKRDQRFVDGDEKWLDAQSNEDKALHLMCENLYYIFDQSENFEEMEGKVHFSAFPFRGSVAGARSGAIGRIDGVGGRRSGDVDAVENDELFREIHTYLLSQKFRSQEMRPTPKN